jgi:hypothetical protein
LSSKSSQEKKEKQAANIVNSKTIFFIRVWYLKLSHLQNKHHNSYFLVNIRRI